MRWHRSKRAFDVMVSLALLLLLWPLMLLLALAVYADLGRPVLFRQLRPGLNARPFTLIKFRTMRDATDPHGRPLPDHERVTPLGTFMRRSSLDELPELINVLRGDMSLVGPRPLLLTYLGRYSQQQARRHEVRPGITGWAQVHGRNQLSWEEKFDLDVWYVDHASLVLDLRVLLLTALAVVRRDGILPAGQQAVPEFLGSGASTSRDSLEPNSLERQSDGPADPSPPHRQINGDHHAHTHRHGPS